MLDTVIETTPVVRASADLAVVNEELAHRLKNTLAMVQAIASQTLRDVTEQESVNSFRQRLQSLAHAHDVLLRQSWSAVSLKQVIEDSLRPHDHAGQIELNGPAVEIGSRTTMSLSLMLHELATNALKYGALSEMGGKICINWSISNDMFHLNWKETGGPRVSEPSRKGFGSRLIARGIGNRCEVIKSYHPEGFELELETPLADLNS
nr:sensor histidine kinase [Altericroceibacterium indicum]